MDTKLFLILVLALVQALLCECTTPPRTENFVCKNGVPYEENNCNICNCHNGHIAACSQKACLNQDTRNCVVGATWIKGECDKCWCVKDLGQICTKFDDCVADRTFSY